MKQATTVEQQIAILEQRGMTIDTEHQKTKEILSDIGYFRLGFYCFPFEETYPNRKKRTHKYKPGTKFSDVVSLYYLDADLRKILAYHLNRIEINFRTNIIYTVSNHYINNNIWFIDPTAVEKKFDLHFLLSLLQPVHSVIDYVVYDRTKRHYEHRYFALQQEF
jgi:abortive infection bacteriophage resistance protein